MKKILMAAAALCCTMTMSLTSCSQSDNPIEPKPEKQVAMADVVTLDAWPHSFYKLDTKELLPISIAVNRIYEDEQGETQFYDLSTVTVTADDDMFDVDASHLTDGIIQLVPNPEAGGTKSLIEDVEEYGAMKWEQGIGITLTNSRGETLTKELQLVYLPINVQKEVLNITQADLNENNELVIDEPAVLKQFNLREWPHDRLGDISSFDLGELRDARITDDGKLLIRTWGDTTEPGEPFEVVLTFTRKLTTSPYTPYFEPVMVNVRYELELNISE